MKTAAQYEHDISDLNLEGLKTEGLSGTQAEETLRKITEAQEKLHQIEASLNLDLHALERQFQGRATSVNTQNANRHGRAKVEEEQRLEVDKERKLSPYLHVKKRIDDLLPEISRMRAELENPSP